MDEKKITSSLVAEILKISVRRVNQLASEGKLQFELLSSANGKFTRVFDKNFIQMYSKERRNSNAK